MQTTNNLGLKKPAAEDVVNIEDLNSNSDALDGKFGASSGHGHTGTAGDGPKIGSDGLVAGAATDTVIGSRTVSDATAPTGDSGTSTTLFGWLANMIKAITGGATWRTLPGMTIAAIKNILDAATNAGTASTLLKRDASGRAQVAAPSAAADIANKGYVDTAVSGVTIPDASLTVKGKVQLSSAVSSTSEVLAATAKAVKDAYDRGSAGISAAAAAQSTANTAATIAGAALPASAYTAADILAKIKTVDGSGSGLSADDVQGLNVANIARWGSTSAAVLNNNTTLEAGFYITSEGTSMGLPYGWTHVLNMKHNGNDGYNAQIAMPLSTEINSGSMYVRYSNGGVWSSWKKMWTENNLKVSFSAPSSSSVGDIWIDTSS